MKHFMRKALASVAVMATLLTTILIPGKVPPPLPDDHENPPVSVCGDGWEEIDRRRN